MLSIAGNLPQSILLTGRIGVGLSTSARYITDRCDIEPIVILPEKDELVDLDKGTISVGIIRRLLDMTKNKSTSKQIFIIDFAERMTTQAQNAFLKLLEEPNDNVHFILLSHSTSKLLPTIVSRAESTEVRPISSNQSEKLLDLLKQTEPVKRSQLIFMAKGLPAELTRLSTDNEYFEKRSLLVRDARELLTSTLYKKLLIAQKYKDDRNASLMLMLDMAKILQKSIVDSPRVEIIYQINKILNAYQQIEANGNIRLVLAKMVI